MGKSDPGVSNSRLPLVGLNCLVLESTLVSVTGTCGNNICLGISTGVV